MNFKALGKILGKIMILEGILMVAPLLVSFIYNESLWHKLSYVFPIIALVLIGFLLQIPKPKRSSLYQKEGFALVAVVWIVMTLFGALPFAINGDIPDYIDACFEMMSGFTTTGASIIEDITVISHSSLFWRSFSHWIGGMGILVFVLIFIPESNDGSSMHLLRAESPGPQVGKIASKMKVTARILYLIYLGLTILEIIFLLFGKPIEGYENDHFFHCLLTAFGSAGTGGFGFVPGSMEMYSPYTQYVISIFLLLFGSNFALYYLILLGKFKELFKSEELKCYLSIVVVAVTTVFLSLVTRLSDFGYSIESAFRHALFQVSSIMTTTGFTTTDYDLWPVTAHTVLIILMFIGAMAGSTAGGFKISRVVIAIKGLYVSVRKLINPRYVSKVKIEGKSLDEKTISDVFAFAALYIFSIFTVLLILSFDPVNGSTLTVFSDLASHGHQVNHGMMSNLSAVLSCISNIGPGLEAVGPYSNFAGFGPISTLALTFTMLLGRLEILPVLILFNPRTWKKS